MNRTRLFDIAAIALAIAIAIGAATLSRSAGALVSAETAPAATVQRQANTATRSLALFIGDSYTAGKHSAEMSYGCRAAVQLGWLCALSARGGTGYISGGPANRWSDPGIGESHSFKERVSHLATQYSPNVVVLDGGRNDVFAPREDVYKTMVSTFSQVRRAWPDARIVFMRPRFMADPRDNLGFDDAFITRLKSDPAAHGVTFVDPISTFIGTDTSVLLGADGVHLNREGEDLMTKAVVDALGSLHMGTRL
ncbi:hypothetical protein CQY20_00935 [Mycolicibacterium agri]|uniref:SGNH hydrolase-type esterase domain-containing protein n=2 Tax=Mycolicibacterium agri TaxID=36811 RepID=A0A2A7NGD2_MYCAG|nr:hypothetical protein CQY20_00935 [Mycolicibacterium agri]GFG54412.1 hypothetical protein MAGR_58530 [Mycolicibacterium agri]